ncbi:MAG TPA: hypothetical protein VJV79_12610 [Polyangiaceae bacterium]|nr:hypothetical protein [Polyangiaceae bacterium]
MRVYRNGLEEVSRNTDRSHIDHFRAERPMGRRILIFFEYNHQQPSVAHFQNAPAAQLRPPTDGLVVHLDQGLAFGCRQPNGVVFTLEVAVNGQNAGINQHNVRVRRASDNARAVMPRVELEHAFGLAPLGETNGQSLA